VVRHEARRQAREQIAYQMSAMDSNSADWTNVEPLLDEAMDLLDATDRTAILLRYFENKSLREVGEALGASEDAAQKRVSRAVERLRELFAERKVAVGAGALAVVISANAVQAAPAGLAGAIATGTALASTALSTSTAIAVTKTIAMTTLQKIVIGTVAAAAVVAGVFEVHQALTLRGQAQLLQQQQAQQAALSNQLQELQRERDRATNALAALVAKNATQAKSPNELLKLRGEVGRLQQENTEIRSSSPLSKVTASPEARKMLRDSQKAGMGMIYKEFAKHAKLTSEQTDKFNDLLADHILANVDHVTTALHDNLSPEQMDGLFAAQETTLQEQVQALLGPDGLAQYQSYTKTLLGSLTTAQFGPSLSGSDAAKAEKSKQLFQAVQEETQAALVGAALPADYQPVPILNFRNIASEQTAEQSLKLLDDIYQHVAARSSSFLSADELASFQQFRNSAITNTRTALALNRTMMAPISK
jgi:hypothetical protein